MDMTENLKKMKAVRLHKIGKLQCDEVEIPVPKGEELLVKVGACGVCGSDYPRVYEHGTSSGIYPLTIGHEFAGEVVGVGSKENEYLLGTKAALYPLIPCRECDSCVMGNYAMCEHYDYLGSRRDGGFAEYCLVPSKWQLVPAQNATMEELAMTEPACVAQHAVRRGNVEAGQFVVIFGAGPIGIMAARWVKLFGATPLLADIAQDKVDFAKEKGLDVINSAKVNVPDAIRERNHGKLADVAIEGTGAGTVLSSCMECVRAHGVVSLLGNPSSEAVIPIGIHSQMLRKELIINGVWNSSRSPYPVNEWSYTVKMLDEGKLQVADLITGRYSLEELPQIIDAIHSRTHHDVKTMCICGQNK